MTQMCQSYMYRIMFPEFVLLCSKDILFLKTSLKIIKQQLGSRIYDFEVSSILSLAERLKKPVSYIFQKKWEGITYAKIRVITD